MNVVIERPPQVVHDPLPDAGCEVGVEVATGRAGDGDHGDGDHRDVEHSQLAGSDPPTRGIIQPGNGLACSR